MTTTGENWMTFDTNGPRSLQSAQNSGLQVLAGDVSSSGRLLFLHELSQVVLHRTS